MKMEFMQDLQMSRALDIICEELAMDEDTVLRKALKTSTYRMLMYPDVGLMYESAECIAFLFSAELNGDHERFMAYWEAD